MFWVYILQNPEAKFYIGQTDNLQHDSDRTTAPIGLMATSHGRTGPGIWYGVKRTLPGLRRWRENVKSKA